MSNIVLARNFESCKSEAETVSQNLMMNSVFEKHIEEAIRRKTETKKASVAEDPESFNQTSLLDNPTGQDFPTRKDSHANDTPAQLQRKVTLVRPLDSESKNLDGAGKLQTDEYIYTGQWNKNKFNGYGRIIKKSFALYEGIFVDNKRDGYGVEIYANSDIYMGQFKADKKHGLGVYFFSNGGYYYGQFDEGFRAGFGSLYNKSNKHAYIGFWVRDQRHGRGVEIYKNGSKYDGFFVADKREGIGFMEYSKSLQYLGEWNKGLKHGFGRVEHNKKSISGQFEKDVFVKPSFYNVTAHTEQLAKIRLDQSVETYLKRVNYDFKRPQVRNYGEIYAAVKDSLVIYVLALVEKGILRLSCYFQIKSIFSKASRFEYFIEDIIYILKSEPNIEKQCVFWDSEQREFLIDKTNYFWEKSELKVEKSKTLFDDSFQQSNSLDIQIVKLSANIQAIITNEFVFGSSAGEDFEAVVKEEQFTMRSYNKVTAELEHSDDATIFPFFIHLKTKEKQFIYSLNPQLYFGEFFFGKDIKHPLKISLFLSLDSENHWYSVGLDSVGVFTLSGKLDKQRSTGELLQKYVQNYQINYNMFLATSDKLQGNWNTTNMNGHFILRKDPSFKFAEKLSRVFNMIHRQQSKLLSKDLANVAELKPFFTNSILAVISKGMQGGIPAHCRSKENPDQDSILFEKFRKQKKLNFDEIKTNQSLESSFKKGEEPSIIHDDNSLFLKPDPNLSEHKVNISKANRMSLELLNLQALKQNVNLKQLQNKKVPDSEAKLKEFQSRLLDSIKGLRRLFDESVHGMEEHKGESIEKISWVGRITTLGREETIIFDHLYIIADVIEGVLTDETDVTYEIAGSYSQRTCEFEMIGMSLDKKRTLKVKGTLENFVLKGTLSQKPDIHTSSQIQLKFFGISAKIDLVSEKNEVKSIGLDGYLKIANTYIYGLILFGKEFLVISGIKHPEFGYGFEISSHNKKLKSLSLVQTNFNENFSERVMKFSCPEYEMTIYLDR